MQDLLDKISDDKIPALMHLTPLEPSIERYPFNVHPDDNHTYGGYNYKEYFCRDNIELTDLFKYVVSCEVIDYGYVNPTMGLDMLKEVSRDGCGRLDFQLGVENYRKRIVTVEGILYGDGFVISNPDLSAEVELKIIGVKTNRPLSLFQELILEAYALECEENYRVSFFGYFTALEALITQSLDKYKVCIHDELWYALEHLSIDEKVKVLAKEAFKTRDLNSINSWSYFAGVLREMKDKRNKIAHGQALVKIDNEDLAKMFALLSGLHCYVESQIGDFVGIRKCLYPRKRQKT